MSQLKNDLILPDGIVATSTEEINRWLKQNNLTLASDYSDDFFKKVRLQNEQAERRKLFAGFIHNYKRKIWNE